ncbi:hypothetical protein [Thermococcus pacificus]|uniref:Glycosyltransferase RgtA/B/C/D-like domain-containing protein n=1 Tax=Thermococcus pacificus TaxID=71998 RepID=A0A218P6G6_9EURY|nr:hypothetical protein [Thermococcus pacificus]ASJ06385.1 hypothetical protein A3L08_03075 [Thermococcus pacificus]
MTKNMHKVLNFIDGIIFVFTLSVYLYTMTKIQPASGYEISIYNGISRVLYIVIILYITGVVNIYYQKGVNKILVMLLLTVVTITLILLPELKGYAFFGRHDSMTHAGLVRDILITSRVYEQYNIYPILHIYTAMLLKIQGIDSIFTASREVIVMYFGTFIVFAIMILKGLHPNLKTHQILFPIILFTIPLLTEPIILFRPSSNLFLVIPPILVYLFIIKNWSMRAIKYLVIPFYLLLPFAHFEFVLFATTLVISIIVTKYLYSNNKEDKSNLVLSHIGTLTVFIVLFNVFYVLNSTRGMKYANRIYYVISGITNKSPAEYYGQFVTNRQIPLIEILKNALIPNVAYIVFLGTTGLVLFIVWKYKDEFLFNDTRLFSIIIISSTQIIIFVILAIVSIWVDIVIKYYRFLKYPSLFTFMLLGILMGSNKIMHKKITKIVILSITILIVFGTVVSVKTFGVTPAQITRYNPQVTYSEISGSAWLVQRGACYPISSRMYIPYRFFSFIYGQYRATHICYNKLPRLYPDHFNYNSKTSLQTTYLILTRFEETFYLKIPEVKKLHKFNEIDYMRLQADNYFQKVYVAPGMKIFLGGV